MKKLEEAARKLADEAAQDLPKRATTTTSAGPSTSAKGSIQFIRSNATDEELGELTKTNNPDEINIDEGDSDDEGEVEEVQLKAVPTEVFGGLVQEDT